MKKQKETKKRFILLTFNPFLQIARLKFKLLPMRKKEETTEIEWSLDCSGQGECQPNVSPSDGEEKIDFVTEHLYQKQKK